MTASAARKNSFQLEASRGDGYLRALASGGGEIELLQAAFEALQPEDAVVLDVGANIGFTALTMSRLRPGARILAFEPSPSTFEFLKRNVYNNACENIEPIQLALSNKCTQAGWTQDPIDSSSAHLSSAGEGEVSVSTIDDVVADMQRQPTFIKIDVEGCELAALEGAEQTIEAGSAILLIELNSFSAVAYGDVSPKVLIRFVLDRYERVFWLDGSQIKELRSDHSVLELLHVQLTTGRCVHDLLCVPRDVPFDLESLDCALKSSINPSRTLLNESILKFEFGSDELDSRIGLYQTVHTDAADSRLCGSEGGLQEGKLASFRRVFSWLLP